MRRDRGFRLRRPDDSAEPKRDRQESTEELQRCKASRDSPVSQQTGCRRIRPSVPDSPADCFKIQNI